MRLLVQKFAQSCFKVSNGRTALLIDPGVYNRESYQEFLNNLDDVSAVLISHQHPDHCDLEIVKLLASRGLPIFSNRETQRVLNKENVKTNLLESGKEVRIGDVSIKVFKANHFKLLFCKKCNSILSNQITIDKKCQFHPELIPSLVDGPENVGFLINQMFFHPGDSLDKLDFRVDNLAVAIAGPTVDYQKALDFAQSFDPKIIIPMHYSNSKFPADPIEFAQTVTSQSKVEVLEFGQSISLNYDY